MAFDSIFFISCFLPVVWILHRLLPGLKAKNAVLLLLSLVFYLFTGPAAIAILLLSIAVNYLLGLALQGKHGRKVWLILGIVCNTGLLFVYKYLDFVLAQLPGLSATGLVAPLGISFFTFKSISYLADTYRDPQTGTKNPFRFALYISFFPQIAMGPITRYADFAPQLTQRTVDTEAAVQGLMRFVVGLAKKVYLSAALGAVVDPLFSLQSGALDIRAGWVAAIGYSLQLFLDFSGCMDMAIGLGRTFGFSTAENFCYPYIARTIGDFWRRWHMTLSGWFKDYIYIPLGGNRKGALRAGFNKCVVFVLCGLWHGANWTFLLWGIWHGLFSLLESTGVIPAKKLSKHPLGHVYTLLVVVLGFVMFRATSVADGFAMLGAMFTGFRLTDTVTVALRSALTLRTFVLTGVSVIACLPVRNWLQTKKFPQAITVFAALVLFVLCVIRLAAGDFAPAIYAQF